MALEALLKFKNIDSTENINARLAGLIPKGVLKGGVVTAEPASLQVRVKGTLGEPWVLLAFSSGGMLIRERSEEYVLPVVAGVVNVVVLRAKYLESQAPLTSLEVMTLGAYQADTEKDSLIRLASVTPPLGAVSVNAEDIDLSFRDSIEGFTRRILRDVVTTKEDLPAVSGFPATAEINFVANNFLTNTTISVSAGLLTEVFSIVPAINFVVGSPSIPGLSRVNPSQKSIVSAVEAALSGIVTVTTATPHGLAPGNQIRISGSSAPGANSVWTVDATGLTASSFRFVKGGSATPFTSTGGNLVNTAVIATVTVKLAPGVTHDLVASQPIVVTNATDPSFNVTSSVSSIVDAQTFTYQMTGFPTGDSGNGKVTKVGFSLPPNGVEIGESATVTAANFETAFLASGLSTLIKANAIGSSIQLEVVDVGILGNTYTISKAEPGVVSGSERIVLSGATFSGGADPIAGLSSAVDLRAGDLYIVLFGDIGTMEIWGYDGTRFRNLTSAATITLLDFHRRNLLPNEKHLTENEKSALVGTVGTPSATNPFVTKQDTSILTNNLADALQGADNETPSGANRFLTEARVRGERGAISIPGGTNLSIPAANVNAATDVITYAAHGMSDGFAVSFTTSGVIPSGLLVGTTYYVVSSTLNTFKVALTFGGAAIDIISSGSGTHTLVVPYQDWVKLPASERWVVGTETDSALQYFNVVFNSTLKNAGGPDEYTQQSFTPVKVDKLYIDKPFITGNELNPADALIGADGGGVYPRAEAPLLGNPTDLYVKLTAQPNNGVATVFYSRAAKEKVRATTADMLMGPQRITPASIKDVENKVAELRFNAGITVSGTSITFPSSLFVSSNLQNFKFRRAVGGKLAWLSAGFTANFATGTGTAGIIENFSTVTFPAASTWSKYILSLASTGKINTYKLEDHLEFSTDLAFDTSVSTLATSNLAFTKGEWVFAVVAVKSNALNTGIEDLVATSVELYPYQSTNSRDAGAEILVGDGTNTFGHFSGTGAHIRALKTAQPYDRIKLLRGTYLGQFLINKDNITVEFSAGAALQHQVAAILLNIVAANVNFVSDTFTSTAHGLSNGHLVSISSGGTLPAGLSAAINYYVITSTTNTFQLSLTPGGAAVNMTSAGAGTHTVELVKVAFNVNAANFRAENPRFINSSVGMHFTSNATNVEVFDPTFSAAVTRFTAATALTAPDVRFRYANVATWICTDGTSTKYVGDFNSANALNDAHAAASAGDKIIVYPGTYTRITGWTKSQIQVEGYAAGQVFVDGGGSNAAITISGSGNFLQNLVLQNASIGISCSSGAAYNTFADSVVFASNVIIPVKFPTTSGTKHNNFHPVYSGNISVSATSAGTAKQVVTCGDGISSWGDYTGIDAINQAILAEQEGTTIKVAKGSYVPITGLTFNRLTFEGSGDNCLIRASYSNLNAHCINIVGSFNSFRGFHLEALNNGTGDYNILGFDITGSDNTIERISFTDTGTSQIVPHRRYKVASGVRNRFFPHTGSPTGYISWTVGDGKRSFGDFNGLNGITSALTELPPRPRGLNGDISNISGAQATFEDFTVPAVIEFVNTSSSYYVDSLYRHLTISTGPLGNRGSWKVIQVLSATSVRLERFDGGSWTTSSGHVWDLLTGSKIWVLPGTYQNFTIQETKNDVYLQAWGSGSDVIIQGGSPCILVKGNRCRISGFRLEDPGTGIQVTGSDNLFEGNRFGTNLTAKYLIDTTALRNRMLDSIENNDKVAYVVSTLPSRGDFVGSTHAAIQAAVTAAGNDPHIKTVYIGAGSYTFAATVNVPASVTVVGSGYGTLLTGTGAFAAFTLNAAGGHTISGIRFNNFSNSLTGPAANVFAQRNWLVTAPINGNVTGNTTGNL